MGRHRVYGKLSDQWTRKQVGLYARCEVAYILKMDAWSVDQPRDVDLNLHDSF